MITFKINTSDLISTHGSHLKLTHQTSSVYMVTFQINTSDLSMTCWKLLSCWAIYEHLVDLSEDLLFHMSSDGVTRATCMLDQPTMLQICWKTQHFTFQFYYSIITTRSFILSNVDLLPLLCCLARNLGTNVLARFLYVWPFSHHTDNHISAWCNATGRESSREMQMNRLVR